MSFINKVIKSDDHIRRMQDVCGLVFITMFALQLVFQSLIFFGVVYPGQSWYAIIVAVLSVTGFYLLYRLSSNQTAEVFAASLLGFELFFMFGRPYLLQLTAEAKPAFPVVFIICFIFSVMALYLWVVLFNNEAFRRRDMPWLMLLPFPFLVNILGYGGHLSMFEGVHSLASMAIMDVQVMALIRMVLAVVLPVGYWRLSHSTAFSGASNDLHRMSFSPLNLYFTTYGLIALILLLPIK